MNEFKQLLEDMDWTYQFSDHYGTFEKGRADMHALAIAHVLQRHSGLRREQAHNNLVATHL